MATSTAPSLTSKPTSTPAADSPAVRRRTARLTPDNEPQSGGNGCDRKKRQAVCRYATQDGVDRCRRARICGAAAGGDQLAAIPFEGRPIFIIEIWSIPRTQCMSASASFQRPLGPVCRFSEASTAVPTVTQVSHNTALSLVIGVTALA